MKEFIIKSQKYGDRKVLIDDEDFDLINNRIWNLRFDKNTFYAISNAKYINGKRGKQTIMHRLIMGADDYKLIDHKDGNGLNNQKSNLRFATLSENARNYSTPKNNSTGYKGVNFISKYRAYIVIDKRQKFLGYFKTAEEAALAYNEAAKRYFGEFAKLNEV